MSILNKSAFIEAAKPKVEKVEIGEDRFALVCEISQDAYEKLLDDPENKTSKIGEDGKPEQNWFKTMTSLIIASVMTEEGNLMFDESDKDLVAGFSRAVRTKITDASLKANGFSADEKKPSEPTNEGSVTGE